jgi:hypothetical protein
VTGRTSALRWKHYGSATLVAASLISGGALLTAPAASAAESTSATPSASSSAAPAAPVAGTAHKSHLRHAKSTPLTGDIAAKVKAAALAKYPGATVRRVDTDSHGTYEAHLVTAAGRHITVKIGRDFAVRSARTGTHENHATRGQARSAVAKDSSTVKP